MFDKFLNFYSKYPWVALIIVVQWLVTAYIIIYTQNADTTLILGLTFATTVIFGYFGFKIPKG